MNTTKSHFNILAYDLVIEYSRADKSDASLKNKLSDVLKANGRFSSQIEKLESTLISDFKSGVDLNSPERLESLYICLDALTEAIKRSKAVVIIKKRVLKATIVETHSFEVDPIDWLKAFSECAGDHKEALLYLQSNFNAFLLSKDVDILHEQEVINETVER